MKVLSIQALAAISACVLIAGCASGSSEIKASYVSPMTYENYTCQQLLQENLRLQQQLSYSAGTVDQKAHNDKVKMGVGLVLFWPTLFFLKGDGAEAQEYARLKGQHEAFEQTYIKKDCANSLANSAATGQTIATGGASPSLTTSQTSYDGPGASGAKSELAKYQCFDNFSLVSESAGKRVFEATCKSGKRQLLECYGAGCRLLN